MANLAEILLAQAKQRGSIEFRVSTDVVVGVRMQRLAILIPPLFLGVVAGFSHNRARTPVLFFTRKIAAALDDQDLLACRSKLVGQGSATRAAANDDDVVVMI